MVAVGDRVFGKYEVIRRLAVGGMGEIFLARQTGVVDRLVILKNLLPQLAADAQAVAAFLDEARILGSINHPNVVALYDVGEWDGTHYIAMEFINGVDVSNLLKFCEDNKKRLPPLVSAQIIREAALGLDAAHVATDATGTPLRIVHRDISPHNLMVRQDGLCKVVDFGVAVADNRQQKTEAGLLKGKLGYMPPEQIKGAPVEPKADQFSLGVLFWEMLTQRRLFYGENAAQVFMRILKEKVPPPSSLVQDVPPELDAVVLRMTAQEPVDRFPRLGDAAMALRRALDQYKVPDNATAQLIRGTVGNDLAARLKELASATPARPSSQSTPSPARAPAASGTPQSTPSPTRAPAASGTPQPTAAPVTCGACGTPGAPGDRFCRSCGATIGGGARTGAVPRVDVLASSSTTGTVRGDPPASGAGTGTGSNPFLVAPRSAITTAATDLAVVAGLVEMIRNGVVVPSDADGRTAAFAVLEDIARRGGLTLKTAADTGRFAFVFVGDNAIANAVALARGSVRIGARIGQDVLLRMGVAAECGVPPDQAARVRAVADQLVDNAAPGSAVIVDLARTKSGDPPTTRSASVSLREGGAVIAHELSQPRRLVGRSAEIAAIDAALEQVERDKKAAQIMLLGDGGVGKSALLEVGIALARDRGFLVGLARGARVREALALDVLRQLVKSVCLDLLARERLSGAWTRAVDLCGMPPAYAMRLKAIIDDESDVALRDVPAARRRAVLKASVIAFFEKLAERAPVLLVVDDFERGDAPSFELLAEIGARLGDRRLAVLVAGRPVQGERILPLAKRVAVGTLSPVDILGIASQVLAYPVGEPLASLLVQRSLGNALVLTLLLRHLLATRALSVGPYGVTVNVDLERSGLPANPTVLIHANHATLPPEAQSLLLAAAHIGQVVEPAQLFRVVDGVRDIAGMLKGLCDVGILEPLSGDQFAFKSTVELETIPARLDASQARLLQQRVADALARDLEGRFTLEGGERLATHLAAAEARPRAAEISTRVAERAAALGLFELAADHWKRALQHEWRTLTPAAATEEKASRVLRFAAAATQCLAEIDAAAAVDLAAPVLKSVPPLLGIRARVEALRQRGLVYARLKRFSEAENCLDEALETLATDPDPTTAAGLLIDLASILEQRGDVDSASTQLQEALRLLGQVRQSQPDATLERSFDGLVLLGRLSLRQRAFARAREAFLLAIEDARRNGRAAAEADARALLGAVAQAEGNLDTAVQETEQAILLAENVGDPVLEARLRQQLGRALVALGRRGDAAVALGRALECARRGQWDEGVSAAQQLLAVVGG